MFQRLKATIDNKIAEEQAKSRFAAYESPPKASTNTNRNGRQAMSPSPAGRVSREPQILRPDTDFTIDDDDDDSLPPDGIKDDPTRGETSARSEDTDSVKQEGKALEVDEKGSKEDEVNDNAAAKLTTSPRANTDLPSNVRARLRKLEKMESQYHELLRSYRVAHSRVQLIESFEHALKENTPLTSIAEPGALIEYLGQVNRKSDMLLDELKRVSSERDQFKKQLAPAEVQNRAAHDELKQPALNGDDEQGLVTRTSVDKQTNEQSISTQNVGSSQESVLDRNHEMGPAPNTDTGPSLVDPSAQLSQIEQHTAENSKLKADLNGARESAQNMMHDLEQASRKISSLTDSNEQLLIKINTREKELEALRHESASSLTQATEMQQRTENLQAEKNEEIEKLKICLSSSEPKLLELQTDHKRIAFELSQKRSLDKNLTDTSKRLEEVTAKLQISQEKCEALEAKIKTLERNLEQAELRRGGSSPGVNDKGSADRLSAETGTTPKTTSGTAASKKKGKKNKKKTGQGEVATQSSPTAGLPSSETRDTSVAVDTMVKNAGTQDDVQALRETLAAQEQKIEQLQERLKEQGAQQEEIDSLRDELVNIGQEHVEAKEQLKTMKKEREGLLKTLAGLEKEMEAMRNTANMSLSESQQKQEDTAKVREELGTRCEELSSKVAEMQTDLTVAQQLASSRFRELNELKSIMQKAQPEMKNLRSEVVELKGFKESLTKKEGEMRRLETRHEELRSEVTKLKQAATARESQIRSLSQLNSAESAKRIKAEEGATKSQSDVQRLELEKTQGAESLAKVSKELGKLREELATHKSRLREAEQQLSSHRMDTTTLREDLELKAAQYTSAQSLMSSMRDQAAEMATQAKEARERCDSLEEEVADAHRLLSERTREGETMRRLLADVETRADLRTREMKERMDTAIDERDRAEEEASTASRRRARELDDIRTRLREMERSLRRSEDDREELQSAQREWKRRREDLEQTVERMAQEVKGAQDASKDAQDALQANEEQIGVLDRQRAEFKKAAEDTAARLERMQKSNKALSDEISKLRNESANIPATGTTATQSRMPKATPARISSESTSRTRQASVARSQGQSTSLQSPKAAASSSSTGMDYVYLKNVLLQFLEQRDKKHQMQLLPVLAMLLHFEGPDEARWMAAMKG